MPEEGFLRRWARVKATGPTQADAQAEAAARAAAAATAATAATATTAATAAALSATSSATTPAAPPAAAPAPAASRPVSPWSRAGDVAAPMEKSAKPSGPSSGPSGPGGRPAPTLDDVARLTPESDYSIFVGRGVDKSVQRLALKKLFADPHFNVMDRLDMYMDDYNIPSPVSEEMLASLDHARSALRRFVEDPPALAAEAAPAADGAGAAVLAEAPAENALGPAEASAPAGVPAPGIGEHDAPSDAPPHNEAAHAAAAHEHSPVGERPGAASTHEHGPFHRPNQQLSQGQV